ncbi:heavy metal-associated isoprenylated plant protein 43-like [Benincasa hispida]|uniref:heavy metal-associated isoprenylated plant protein 43-like n=1 Tax=Benincasa hispida TaxID=102211 RepID=UPI001901CE8B|nr:heavy metal-associated isoprenylated plant protein 43-like [Benincasa hispida]
MAQTKTVLKLDIACQKCKTKVLKAVTSIEGVDKVETDEAKGTLSVTGTADPVDIVKRTRKAISCAGKIVDVVSIGPPPKPEEKKPDDKKPDDKKPAPPPCPCPCPPYPPYSGSYVVVPCETNPSCSIL